MAPPTFRDIPSPAELRAKDWTTSKSALDTLKALEGDLKFNTKARADFLTACRKNAENHVKELEETVVSLKNISKRNGVKLPDVDKLKTQRTEVKSMMGEAKACENDFFNAVSSFRSATTFNLPEKVEAAIAKIRGGTQTIDKQYADHLGIVIALEARASAALKSVNAAMGTYDDDAKTIEKMTSMFDKLSEMQKKANTASERIVSSVAFVKKNMENKDKKIAGLCEVKSAEIVKEASLARQFQVAVKTGTVTIKSLHDSIGDAGMKTNQGRPVFDDANKALIDVLANMDKADKALVALYKEKALPKNLKSALPAGVK